MKNISMIKIGTLITFWLDSEHNIKKTEVILSRERYKEDGGKTVNLYITANHMVHEAQLVNEY